MPRLAWIPSERLEIFAGGKLENEAPGGLLKLASDLWAFAIFPGLTIVRSCAKHDRHMDSGVVSFRDDELFGVDDAAILDDIAGNCVVILDSLSVCGLQTSDLSVKRSLVAAQALEDLLTSNGIGLVHGVVGAVSSTVVAIESKSATATEVTLRNSSCDQVLADDSRRTKQRADRSCTSTATNL
jgi:hypothetical protein